MPPNGAMQWAMFLAAKKGKGIGGKRGGGQKCFWSKHAPKDQATVQKKKNQNWLSEDIKVSSQCSYLDYYPPNFQRASLLLTQAILKCLHKVVNLHGQLELSAFVLTAKLIHSYRLASQHSEREGRLRSIRAVVSWVYRFRTTPSARLRLWATVCSHRRPLTPRSSSSGPKVTSCWPGIHLVGTRSRVASSALKN